MRHLSSSRFFVAAFVVTFLFILISLPLSVQPAHAQCAPRADWPIHTVQRGETLYRIALRYRTTTAVLVSANCITNAGRIFAGQRLRVPPGVPPSGDPAVTTSASYQEFENGFMIWRADNSTIYVFGHSGQYLRYPVNEYGLLPDRPFTEPQPPGRSVPILGFGKVWKNIAAARALVGWAATPEMGYTITFRTVTSGGQPALFFNTPLRGDALMFTNSTAWAYADRTTPVVLTPPPPNPTPTAAVTGPNRTQGAYQGYENGYMIWRNDSGMVYVLYRSVGATSGTWQSFPVSQYQGWPEPQDAPPNPALIRPINAFGRVWGSAPGVRGSLGWAVQNEVSYMLCDLSADAGITNNIYTPAGTLVLNSQNSTWAVAGYQGPLTFEAGLVAACGTS